MAMQDARVVDTRDMKAYVAYVINVTRDGEPCYEVVTRFSEVELLCAKLKRKGIAVPPLPRKHMFGSKGRKVVEERKEAINKILEEVVEKHSDCEDIVSFLSKDQEAPAAERMSRTVDVVAEQVKDAFNGELFEHTWETARLGMSLTSHMMGDGTVIAVVHQADEENPKQIVNTVIESVNGERVPTSSQAEILTAIKEAPRPVTIGFRMQSGEEISAPISWEDQKEDAMGEAGAAPAEAVRERADTGNMDPERLSEVLSSMDHNEDGMIDEAEFQKTLETADGPKPQLLHYLKLKRWLKKEFSETYSKDKEALDKCLDSEGLLKYMQGNELSTEDIPESCYVLQRVDAL